MRKKIKGIKGQAAIEYLATYGWALLLLVIVLGAIISTGVLAPTYLISEECNLGPNLPCSFIAYGDDASTSVAIEVTNGFAYPIKISKFAVISEKKDTGEEITDFDILNSGDKIEQTFNIPNLVVSGSNNIEKFKTEIVYVSCAPEINPDPNCDNPNTDLQHTLNGRLTARIVKTQ